MRRLTLLIGIFMLTAVPVAVCQVRIEFTAKGEEQNSGKRATVWATRCEARLEDDGSKENMYVLLKDCGDTMVAVLLKHKTALQMPPMQESAAPDLITGAWFMQGTPEVAIEKLEERPGLDLAGRATVYYRFRKVERPDPQITEPVKLIVEEEFWIDPTLDFPVLEGLFGKSPLGAIRQPERVAFETMKGLPLRHRTVVTIEKGGIVQPSTTFVQEVTNISTGPFRRSLLDIPEDYRVLDAERNLQKSE